MTIPLGVEHPRSESRRRGVGHGYKVTVTQGLTSDMFSWISLGSICCVSLEQFLKTLSGCLNIISNSYACSVEPRSLRGPPALLPTSLIFSTKGSAWRDSRLHNFTTSGCCEQIRKGWKDGSVGTHMGNSYQTCQNDQP